MTIENCNTAKTRGESVCQFLADKWNDPLFFFISTSFLDLHVDFSCPILETVSHMHPPIVKKCEEKWLTLNLQLNHVIQKWEQSGQGGGGFFVDNGVGESCGDVDEDFICHWLVLDQRKKY